MRLIPDKMGVGNNSTTVARLLLQLIGVLEGEGWYDRQ